MKLVSALAICGLLSVSYATSAAARPLTACIRGVANPDKKTTDEVFVGNSRSVYPHLHCGKDFAVFSWSHHDHRDLVKPVGPRCPAIEEILTAQAYTTMNPRYPDEITTGLTELRKDFCPK